MRMLVGFAGYAGSGKDTAAETLISQGYERVAFADPIKELAYKLGWNGVKDEKGRKLLQDAGNIARQYNPEVWIDKALMEAVAHDHVVITDVRHLNEISAIRSEGGVVVWIARIGVGPANGHISENEIGPGDCDLIISNNGTLEELAEDVAKALRRIEYRQL